MSRTPTVAQVLRAATEHLASAGVESAAVDARLLAMHATGLDRAGLLMAGGFPPEHLDSYWELISDRAARVPLQHLTGETGFRYLTLRVRPGVFIPRPETEMVAQVAIDHADGLDRTAVVVDLCTGAGGIALSVAKEVPGSQVWAVDINPAAVDLTRLNARGNDCRVSVLQGDVTDESLTEHLPRQVDVVVSNPPYIPYDAEPVDVEVREHDPHEALYGGGVDGLEVPRAVTARAHRLLREGGLLVIEHGDEQGPAMREAVERHGGFSQVRTEVDLTGRDRMVVAIRG